MVYTTISDYDIRPLNLGPLTTTFTPPATCTGRDVAGPGNEAFFEGPDYLGHVQCGHNVLDACRPPPSTEKVAQALVNAPELYLTYHSPGVVCPSGWTAAESFSKVQPTDGVFRPEREDDELYQTIWPLEPSETLVLCCPENFVFDDSACIGPAATSISPSMSGYCDVELDMDLYTSGLETDGTPRIGWTSTTILLSENTYEPEPQLRAAVNPVVMVHKATDVTLHATATSTTTTTAASVAKTTEANAAKETGKEGTKKSSASSVKMPVCLAAAFAVAVVFAV
ncbi:hypothetical protein PWT90_03387 [Aphanocladium album]|nr:hypothetical protein PWT90_03387 [Aphanocladium album]